MVGGRGGVGRGIARAFTVYSDPREGAFPRGDPADPRSTAKSLQRNPLSWLSFEEKNSSEESCFGVSALYRFPWRRRAFGFWRVKSTGCCCIEQQFDYSFNIYFDCVLMYNV